MGLPLLIHRLGSVVPIGLAVSGGRAEDDRLTEAGKAGYHEFGLQPALVRFRGVAAAWNSLLLVDNPDSVRGGELLGFSKRLASFVWREEVGPGGRASGECIVRLNEQEIVRIRYRRAGCRCRASPCGP